jgi:hypothetical protein
VERVAIRQTLVQDTSYSGQRARSHWQHGTSLVDQHQQRRRRLAVHLRLQEHANGSSWTIYSLRRTLPNSAHSQRYAVLNRAQSPLFFWRDFHTRSNSTGPLQEWLSIGGAAGGPTILDLHSGALSLGEQFIDVFQAIKVLCREMIYSARALLLPLSPVLALALALALSISILLSLPLSLYPPPPLPPLSLYLSFSLGIRALSRSLSAISRALSTFPLSISLPLSLSTLALVRDRTLSVCLPLSLQLMTSRTCISGTMMR